MARQFIYRRIPDIGGYMGHLEVSVLQQRKGAGELPSDNGKQPTSRQEPPSRTEKEVCVKFEKNYRDKGMNVTVTTRGDFHTTLVIEGTIVNRRSVLMMKDTPEAISEFRDMGFKHLMMTNGTAAWDVDLKN